MAQAENASTTSLSRRRLIAGAAALPATALPATAAEPDPIFAVIEAHRAPLQAFDEPE
jgi:hypothetical protein